MSAVRGLMIFMTIVLIAVVSGMGCVNAISFKSNIEDNLKLAGDAPTIERANVFLGNALKAIEARGLTSGNSALLFHMPTQDLGIWYQQIKGAQQTTTTIIEKEKSGIPVAQLERDNALMKIRETVLDQGESTNVTAPENAWIYPYQWLFTILVVAMIVFLLGTIIVIAVMVGY